MLPINKRAALLKDGSDNGVPPSPRTSQKTTKSLLKGSDGRSSRTPRRTITGLGLLDAVEEKGEGGSSEASGSKSSTPKILKPVECMLDKHPSGGGGSKLNTQSSLLQEGSGKSEEGKAAPAAVAVSAPLVTPISVKAAGDSHATSPAPGSSKRSSSGSREAIDRRTDAGVRSGNSSSQCESSASDGTHSEGSRGRGAPSRSSISSESNQSVLNTSMDAILTCWSSGEVHAINNAGEEMFGYSHMELYTASVAILVLGHKAPLPLEAKGMSSEDMMDFWSDKEIDPCMGNDPLRCKQVVEDILHTGCGIRREMGMITKDGKHFPVIVAVSTTTRRGEEDEDEDEEDTMYTVVIRDITTEKEFKRQIEMEKRSLAAIVDTMADAVITMRPDCVVLSFNRAAERLWKYRSSSVVGQNVSMLMTDEVRKRHNGYVRNYINTGEKKIIGVGRDLVAQRSDGTQFPIFLSVSEIKMSGTHIFSAILRDTTQEREAQRQILEDRMRLTAVLDTTPDAIITIGETGIILSFNKAAEKMWGWPCEYVAGKKVNMLMPKCLADEHDSYLQNYIRTGKKTVIGFGRETTAQRRDCTEFPVHLRVSEVVTGEGRYFSAILRDITTEREARRNIQNEQERMGAVLETTVDAIICIDLDGFIQSFNRAAEKMWGWSSEEVIGKKVNQLMPQEIGRVHDGHIKRYLETGIKTVIGLGSETTAQRKDGFKFPIHLAVSEVKTEGGLHIFSAIIRDVTNEKASKALLVEEKHRLNAVLNNTVDAIITMTKTGVILSFNQAAEKMWGLSASEVLDQKVDMLMPGHLAKEHPRFITNYLRTGKKKVIGIGRETTAQRADGSLFPIHLSVSEIKSGDMHMFSALIRDVTEERNAKRLVLEEKQRLEAVLKTTVDAIITINIHGVIMGFNQAAEKMFKFRVAEVLGSKVNMLMPKRLAEEHDSYLQNYLSTGKKKVIGVGRETIAQSKDGKEFPIHLAVSEVLLESGRIFSAIIRDVTSEREARNTLLLAQKEILEEKMRLSAVLETTVDAIISIKPTGEMITYNTAAVDMFGYTATESLGSNISMLMPEEIAAVHDSFLVQYEDKPPEMSRVVSRVGIETQGRRKDGSIFPIHVAVSEVKMDGGVHFFTSIIRDITDKKRQQRRLRQEQRRNEELLLNVLPPSIAKRLKSHERPISDGFDSASILFADVVGFTEMSAQMPPQEVVSLLNDIFEVFDILVEEYGLEKIKTIGDCYMVVAGLPHKRDNHAGVLASFALDMYESLKEWNATRPAGSRVLDMRMGLNCGPVVAGVVGRSKFLYDIWGDTVNVASRMESTGDPGKIQVTAAFVEATKADYDFEYRGEVEVKGKGTMTTHFLTGRSNECRPRAFWLPTRSLTVDERRREALTELRAGTNNSVDDDADDDADDFYSPRVLESDWRTRRRSAPEPDDLPDALPAHVGSGGGFPAFAGDEEEVGSVVDELIEAARTGASAVSPALESWLGQLGQLGSRSLQRTYSASASNTPRRHQYGLRGGPLQPFRPRRCQSNGSEETQSLLQSLETGSRDDEGSVGGGSSAHMTKEIGEAAVNSSPERPLPTRALSAPQGSRESMEEVASDLPKRTRQPVWSRETITSVAEESVPGDPEEPEESATDPAAAPAAPAALAAPAGVCPFTGQKAGGAGGCPVAHGNGSSPRAEEGNPFGMSGCPITQHQIVIDEAGNPTVVSNGDGPALTEEEARMMGAAARMAELDMRMRALDAELGGDGASDSGGGGGADSREGGTSWYE